MLGQEGMCVENFIKIGAGVWISISPPNTNRQTKICTPSYIYIDLTFAILLQASQNLHNLLQARIVKFLSNGFFRLINQKMKMKITSTRILKSKKYLENCIQSLRK